MLAMEELEKKSSFFNKHSIKAKPDTKKKQNVVASSNTNANSNSKKVMATEQQGFSSLSVYPEIGASPQQQVSQFYHSAMSRFEPDASFFHANQYEPFTFPVHNVNMHFVAPQHEIGFTSYHNPESYGQAVGADLQSEHLSNSQNNFHSFESEEIPPQHTALEALPKRRKGTKRRNPNPTIPSAKVSAIKWEDLNLDPETANVIYSLVPQGKIEQMMADGATNLMCGVAGHLTLEQQNALKIVKQRLRAEKKSRREKQRRVHVNISLTALAEKISVKPDEQDMNSILLSAAKHIEVLQNEVDSLRKLLAENSFSKSDHQ